MVALWKGVSAQVWIAYNAGEMYMYVCTLVLYIMYVSLSAVFVACEYILSWDSVYPSYLSVATGTMATILFWRYWYMALVEYNLVAPLTPSLPPGSTQWDGYPSMCAC